jgi:hypothetical protein
VITVSASQSLTAGRLEIAFSYALGSAVVLYFLMLGGRRSSLSPRAGRLQMAMGLVMVVVALAMLGDYDTRFQTAIANDLPAFVVNPTSDLEESSDVREELAGLRDGHGGLVPAPPLRGRRRQVRTQRHCPCSAAPGFVGNQRCSTPGERRSPCGACGRVVLVDFWTYTISASAPALHQNWDERYRDRGLTIVGVHTPEFPFEREAGNVAAAIEQNGLHYPVAQDNDYATWNAYGNQYWPAKYLIDARGRVRYVHFGEGEYEETESAIRELLAEAGHRPGAGRVHAHAETASPLVTTPESYLGAARADRFANGPIAPGRQTFTLPGSLPPDNLGCGTWKIRLGSATASPAQARSRLRRRRVFLVLGSVGARPRQVRSVARRAATAEPLRRHRLRNGAATVAGSASADWSNYRGPSATDSRSSSPPARATPSPSDKADLLGLAG